MSDDGNPMATAQRLARPPLPRRFYREATAGPHEAGFAVLLDGRTAKTPAKRPRTLPPRLPRSGSSSGTSSIPARCR